MQDEQSLSQQIIISPAPFKAPKVLYAEHGLSIKMIIDRMYDAADTPPVYRDYNVLVEIDGVPVVRERWDIIPAPDSHVLVSVPLYGGGGGGKNPLRTVLSIVVIVASIVASIYFPPAIGLAKGTLAYMMASAAAAAVVSTAGMMLVNAIAPIRYDTPSLTAATANSYNDARAYSLGASQNSANKFGPVPVVLGTHLEYPPYGANPYTEIVGNDEYLRMLFIWGYGPLKIEDIKIGDTPIAQYDDVEIETREGRSTDDPITLIPATVHQESIGVILVQADGQLVRSAKPNVDELSVDICFAGGLVRYADDGSRSERLVSVLVEYREIGAPSWTTAHTFTEMEKTTTSLRFGHRWLVDRTKSYEVALTRLTADTTSDMIRDAVGWTYLRSITNEHPVNFPVPLAMTALRIKASEQLQGVIDSLNGIVSSYGETWDGDSWGGEAVTSNPAALVMLTLKHPANARARTDSQINIDNIGAFYEFCASNGFEFNMVRTTKASVWDAVADIAAAGRGAPAITDGLWDIVYDDGEQPVVQHITPRNSWGFEAEKTLFYPPHAFRIPFKNEDENYADDEIIVYDDGYSAANATQFESIEFPGVTSPDLNWKFGRFHIAQARLRPETYSVYQDFEHLVCRRGSKVRVSHDVVMWGSGWGRVKSLVTDGDNTTGVILDETVTMLAGTSYGCRFRLADSDNTSLALSVEGVDEETETSELTFLTAIPTVDGPQVGDLAMFGEASEETVECLVKSIERASDFTAKLILVDVSPAIYTADQGDIPAFDTHITDSAAMTQRIPPAPSITSIESGTSALEKFNGGIRARILVTITPGIVNVRLDRLKLRYRIVGSALWQFLDNTADNKTMIITDVAEGVTYEMQAQSISIYDRASAWSVIRTETVVGQTSPPADVTGFSCNIIGASSYLSWDPVIAVDLDYYRIRWSPLTSGATWAGASDVIQKVSKPTTSVTAPALVGTYLIKAVDYGGRESETAATAITSVARISNLNVVETLTNPPWVGTGDGVAYDSGLGGLILDEAASGYYEFTDVIDLGGVFTARVTASVSVGGQDLLSDLYALDDLYSSPNLYGASEGQYLAAMEIRTTNDDPAGTPTWSSWQSLLVGDYTARAFQFRVLLQSLQTGMTPIVYSITANVDMEDRVVSFAANVPNTGARVDFDPEFYITPAIGITILDMQEGDGCSITNLDYTGFDIDITNGGSGVERNISGIAKAYGAKEV